MKLGVNLLQLVILLRLDSFLIHHLVGPPAGGVAGPCYVLGSEGQCGIRLEAQLVLCYPNLWIIAVYLNRDPHSTAGLTASVRDNPEVGVVFGHPDILVIEIVGDVVGRDIFAILPDVLLISGSPELVLGLDRGVLGHGSIVRVKVEEGELIGKELLNLSHNLSVIREIQSGGLVTDVYAPDCRVIFERSRGLFIFRDGIGLSEFPSIVSVSSPPSGDDSADNSPDPVFAEQVESGTVVFHAYHEIHSTLSQILDMSLCAGIRAKVVNSDVQPVSVHPAGLGDIILGKGANRGRQHDQNAN